MSPRNSGDTGWRDMTSVRKKDTPYSTHSPPHTHTCRYACAHTYAHLKPRNKCYLLFLLSCLILLLVLATGQNWTNALRDEIVTTPQSLIWVLTEAEGFPYIRKQRQKTKALRAYYLSFL